MKSKMRSPYAVLQALLLAACSVLTVVMPVLATETGTNLDLYARSALLMDADNGRVLFEENGYDVMPMASTTKIMTCILALEYGNLDDLVTVSSYAASMPKVKLYIKAGEQYRLEDLLYSLMLQSHNDTAVAIAEHISGSVEEFAALMNQKARDLGCVNTNFVTPNGLDGVDSDGTAHSTTAYDLAKISAYALQNEEFRSIIAARSYSFSSADGKRSFSIRNADAFLDMMPGALGIKTGYTGEAGYCFVGALEDGERTFVSVVLACGWPPHKTYKWHDTRLLMQYGLDNFFYRDIDVQMHVPELPVLDGKQDTAALVVSAEDFSLMLSETEQVRRERELVKYLTAPVEAGTLVGFDRYYIGDELYRAYPIYVVESVEKIDYPYCLEQVLFRFFL